MAHSIFISLTMQDTPIAAALEDALRALVGGDLKVKYAGNPKVGSGPKSGENWMTWIVEQVKNCDFALVLLTPASIQKPWIVWEAGAVFGAAATLAESPRKVRPLLFQVTSDQLPSPIRETHAEFRRGDHPDDVKALFSEIIGEYVKYDEGGDFARMQTALEGLPAVISKYLTTVNAALLRGPGVPTAVAIEEWLSRLESLLKDDRKSEVGSLQDWMEIAFGRQSPDERRPLDLRVHTRLGEVYLGLNESARAVEQFQLARLMAPRDIYVLRSLGRAYLDIPDMPKARAVIDRIIELDGSALTRNPECAALEARYLRQSGRLGDAIDILSAALKNNANSYYLANLQGEISLQADNREQARESFSTALKILEGLRDANIWTHATAANAAFVVSDDERVIRSLRAVMALDPDAADLRTIEGGLRSLAAQLEDGDRRMAAFADVLHPRPVVTASEILAANIEDEPGFSAEAPR